MHCIWNGDAFSNINDYDSWEAELLEDIDIKRHIETGHFVPINIASDGAFEIEIRLGSSQQKAELSDRETTYKVVSSEPYQFRSNGTLNVSGIECVSGEKDYSAVGTVSLKEGEYSVTVHLVAWDEEPGMKDSEGRPRPEALPDFVVLVRQFQNLNDPKKVIKSVIKEKRSRDTR
jgi:hypothetical protein